MLPETTAEPSLQAEQLQLKKARLADDSNDRICQRAGPMEVAHENILPAHASVKEAIASSSPSLMLTNGTPAPSVPRMGVTSQIKSRHKPSTVQRHKKLNNKPKIRKLKYHQYIHPDQKVDKEPSPHLDPLYGKSQQQLFLQLQILGHSHIHTTLPAPPSSLQNNPQPSSCSKSADASSLPPSASSPAQASRSGQSSAALGQAGPESLPPHLDELTVVELKFLLKLRSLPVSGTKSNLIERLRAYRDLSGGSDTTPSPTAGGTAGLGAEAAGSSQTAAATINNNNNNNTTQQQQQLPCHQTSSLTSHSGSIATPHIANPQEVMTCSSRVSSPSFTLSEHLPAPSSPDDAGCNHPAGETLKSPLTRLPVNITEERRRSSPSPSIKPASPRKHSPAALTTTTAAPALTPDKDRMLQEKDERIKELTRMLGQEERQVELLMKQLEHGKGGAPVSEPLVPVRVKEGAPDKPKEVSRATTSQSLESGVLPQCYSQTQESQKNQGTRSSPQQNTLQLAQQQAAQEPLLQPDIRNSDQVLEKEQRLQNLFEQGNKKCHKQRQRLKQQQQVRRILMEEQKTKMHLKRQQVRRQQKGQVQQQQSALAPTSGPALVIDSDGHHFLITLSSCVAENHRTDAPDGTAANQNSPQDKEHRDDFIDVAVQTGETSTSFDPAADPSLDRLSQDSSASPASPFTPQLLLCAPQACPPAQPPELQSVVSATEDTRQLSNAGGGRLEDFLESATGKPLLGADQGGLLTLIDDLHSQMLCSPSILDSPPSPMDTLDIAAVLDSADWSDLGIGGEMEEEGFALATLSPQTPPSVFCTDFLDRTDLQTGMDWPLGIPGIFPVGRRAIWADSLDNFL